MRSVLVTCSALLLVAACAPAPRPGEPTVAARSSNAAADPDGPFVVALGTVQDGGLPHAGCSCPRCERAHADPSARRFVASLGLVIPGRNDDRTRTYLVDATPDVSDQLRLLRPHREWERGRVDRTPVDGVLLTHAHVGHYAGLVHFGFEVMHARDVTGYCTPAMARFLRENGPWSQLVEKRELSIEEITPGTPVALSGGVSFEALRVPHRDEFSDTVAFVLRGPRASLLYVPDTDSWESWNDRSLGRFIDEERIDVAIVDGTFFSLDELPGRAVSSIGHPLITDTLDRLADRVRAGRLRVAFTHLNHSNPALEDDSPARRAIEDRGFEVLREGRVFPL